MELVTFDTCEHNQTDTIKISHSIHDNDNPDGDCYKVYGKPSDRNNSLRLKTNLMFR